MALCCELLAQIGVSFSGRLSLIFQVPLVGHIALFLEIHLAVTDPFVPLDEGAELSSNLVSSTSEVTLLLFVPAIFPKFDGVVKLRVPERLHAEVCGKMQ